MSRIHGIPIVLHVMTQIDTNPLGEPIMTDTTITVQNVLVAPNHQGGQDIIDSIRLDGKRADYILGIPKGDEHDWTDTVVEFFGQKWKTFGMPTEGIDDLIPLEWNKKVLVERYE